jgi:phosphohistidine phosphatase
MQHGLAVPESEDPARPLSAAGRAEVEQVVARAAALGVTVGRVVHSGKARAEQTAEIVAKGLRATAVERHPGLAPNDAVGPVAAWLRGEPDSDRLTVVGHLPFLDRLVGLLVAGDEASSVVAFRNAGLVRLVQTEGAPHLAISWVLVPEIS